MALDKVVDSAALNAGMTSVADAIRAKTGKADMLAWPDGFTAAIAEITGGGGAGMAYDMGEFVLDTDIKASTTGVNHNFGEKPEFILVWTDDFAGLSSDNVSTQQCNLGYIWLSALTGLEQRLSSAATGDGLSVNFTLAANDYRILPLVPNSAAYTVVNPTENAFYIHQTGNSNYWRAGVTYKYFVARAWWNVGGVAIAD